MEQILLDFITALRRSGTRVSLSENVDAMRALDLVGYGDRDVLKDALGACLAKSIEDQDVFSILFDRFFAPGGTSPQSEGSPGHPQGEPEQVAVESPLSELLLSGDAAGVAISMREAGREADLTNLRTFTQKGFFIRNILNRMGWEALNRDIQELDQASEDAGRRAAAWLKGQRDALYRMVKEYVEAQFLLYAGSSPEEDAEHLGRMHLNRVEERDYRRMDALIRQMVKRLNTRHSRRRKLSRRGRVDIKGVICRSIPHQGVPFEMRWKARKVERADIVVLCDVSRSVRATVRFLLLLLYNLSQTLARTRTFVFCSNLVQVDHILEKHPVEEAIARIQNGVGLDMNLGLTDYGRALADFKARWFETVTRKTTVLVLGDGRNNFGDPRTDILEALSLRSKRLIWLNPEARGRWGSGDSEMKRYLPYCHVAKSCRTVRDLERVVDAVLKQYH